MAVTSSRTIRQLIETMSNCDKDYRYMAANDLMLELQQGCRLDDDSEQKISKALLTLLNDINEEVQTKAVKCLVLLSTRLTESNLLHIFRFLIESMAHGEKSSHRMISAIAMKNIVTELSGFQSAALLNLVSRDHLLPMLQIIELQSDDDVLQEAIEILAEILERYGAQMQIHHLRILACLQNVLYSPRQTLRKRAILALGHLLVCIPQQYYEEFLKQVVQGTLSSNLPPAVVPSQQRAVGSQKPSTAHRIRPGSPEEIITRLHCLSVLSHHPSRVSAHVTGLLTVVLSYKQHESDEVREAMLQVLEAFLLRCPTAMVAFIDQLLPLFCQLIQYDPNYVDTAEMEDEADTNQMDIHKDVDNSGEDSDAYSDSDEEEPFTDEDDDDDSWKVRRSAAKCLQACLATYAWDHLPLFYTQMAPVLMKRFREREETVLCEVFSAFRELLNQTRILLERHWGSWSVVAAASHISSTSVNANTSVGSAVSSTTGSLSISGSLSSSHSPYHYRQIAADELLFQNSQLEGKVLQHLHSLSTETVSRLCSLVHLKKPSKPDGHPTMNSRQMRIYREIIGVLRDLVQTLPPRSTTGSQAILAPHFPLLMKLVRTVLCGAEFDSNLRLEAISFLTLLVSRHDSPADFWQEHIQHLIELIRRNIGDSFLRISSEALSLVLCISPRLKSFNAQDQARVLFEPAFKEMLATDRDLELKEQSICAVTSLVSHNADHLHGQLSQYLRVLCERLDNEVTRVQVMRAFIELAESKLSIDLTPTYAVIMQKVPPLFRQNDRSLRLTALKCLEALWRTRGREISLPELGVNVLKEISHSLQEYDTQIIQVALLLTGHIIQALNPNFLVSRDDIPAMLGRLLGTSLEYLHNGMMHGPALDALVHLLGVISSSRAPVVSHEYLMEAVTRPLKGNKLTINHSDAMSGIAACVAELVCHQSSVNQVEFIQRVTRDLQSLSIPNAGGGSSSGNLPAQQVSVLTLAELGRYLDKDQQLNLLTILFQVLHSRSTPGGAGVGVSVGGGGGSTLAGDNHTTCGAHEELKKTTASALGRMAAYCLSSFVPLLIHEACTEAPQQPDLQYFLLHALKEMLTYICGAESDVTVDIQPFAMDIWEFLVKQCDSSADGTRNLVGECIGKIILLHPIQLMPLLVAMISQSKTGSQRTVLFCATKFAVWNHLPRSIPVDMIRMAAKVLDENLLNLLEPSVLMLHQTAKSVDGGDLASQRAILIYFNTLLHLRGALVRQFWMSVVDPTNPGFVTHLTQAIFHLTHRRQELIQMVEMGPFKHQQDAGLDIRKCAYECMNSLMENCLDVINMQGFCEALERGLEDSNELKHLAFMMLIRLCSLKPNEVACRVDRLLHPIKQLLQEKGKREAVKQEQDKLMDLKRSALKVVAAISFIADINSNGAFNDFMKTSLPVNTDLRNVYDNERRELHGQQQLSTVGHPHAVSSSSRLMY